MAFNEIILRSLFPTISKADLGFKALRKAMGTETPAIMADTGLIDVIKHFESIGHVPIPFDDLKGRLLSTQDFQIETQETTFASQFARQLAETPPAALDLLTAVTSKTGRDHLALLGDLKAQVVIPSETIDFFVRLASPAGQESLAALAPLVALTTSARGSMSNQSSVNESTVGRTESSSAPPKPSVALEPSAAKTKPSSALGDASSGAIEPVTNDPTVPSSATVSRDTPKRKRSPSVDTTSTLGAGQAQSSQSLGRPAKLQKVHSEASSTPTKASDGVSAIRSTTPSLPPFTQAALDMARIRKAKNNPVVSHPLQDHPKNQKYGFQPPMMTEVCGKVTYQAYLEAVNNKRVVTVRGISEGQFTPRMRNRSAAFAGSKVVDIYYPKNHNGLPLGFVHVGLPDAKAADKAVHRYIALRGLDAECMTASAWVVGRYAALAEDDIDWDQSKSMRVTEHKPASTTGNAPVAK
ncbi:hypothetical protein GGR57DRAFT_477191 [Xylariaceae sp. FL1272]|nr:hypothetical protein GGR57DRAFT_477191 [Xylariaceae sp. FL1272]